MKNKLKITVIGLDGAGYYIIDDWIKKGYLPNLKRIAQNGVFTILNSSFVPITPIAWTSITTGKNSGKHGIYDWSVRKGNTYEFDIVSSAHCKAHRVWTILNKYGYSTGVFNIPITYPPENVDGFFVSGFDAPNIKSDFTRPSELKTEILSNIPEYELFAEVGYTKGEEKTYTETLKRHLRSKRDAINYLLDKFDCDFNIFVVMELDHLHHKLWRLVENESPLAIEVYALVDEIVGDILNRKRNENIMVISDHGGGCLKGVVYLNNWLMKQGFLFVNNSFLLKIKYLLSKWDLIGRAYRIISKLGLGWIKRFLSKQAQEMLATSFISFRDINWAKTKAFAMGEFGQIYINLKGKYEQGIVDSEEYDFLIDKIIDSLKKIKDKDGSYIVDRIFKKKDLYTGEYVDDAPDVIFSFKDYAYDSSVKFGFEQKDVIGEPEFEDTGTHRREGIFLACGPIIQSTSTKNVFDINDITPTLLYMLGCPIDKNMDGKVLKEIFTDEFLKKNKINFVDGYDKDLEYKQIDEKDKEEVAKRLKALGYMD